MNCTNCSQTKTITPCASGCTSTINANCVIYDGDVLCFEDGNVDDGDKRVLSDLLKKIECHDEIPSKIVSFNSDGETDDGDSYTIVAEDTTKILLLTFTDNSESGTFTNTIVLPSTAEFIDKEIWIKDISTVTDNQVTFLNYEFNVQIQYSWNPLLTTNAFYDLADPVHKVLKLKLVKINDISYQWLVVSNNFTGDITTYSETVTLLNDWENGLGFPVRVHRKGNEVKFSGLVQNGENATVTFNLSADFRPSYNMVFLARCSDTDSNGWATVLITTAGIVSVAAEDIAGGVNLDGGVYLSGINYYIT